MNRVAPNTHVKSFDWRDLDVAFGELLKLRRESLDDDSRELGHRCWALITSVYGQCDLEYETDRPEAIRGIISVIRKETSLRFLAGVCVDFFPYFLLWKTPSDCELRPFGSLQRKDGDSSLEQAPSWSVTYLKAPRCIGYLPWVAVYMEALCFGVHIDEERLQLSFTAKSVGPFLIQMEGPTENELENHLAGIITLIPTSLPNNTSYSEVYMKARWKLSEPPLTSTTFTFSLDIALETPVEAHLVTLARRKGEENCWEGILVNRIDGEGDFWRRIGVFDLDARHYNRKETTDDVFEVERQWVLR